MKKCKVCGGNCVSAGGGIYECDCCGGRYSEEDFAPARKTAAEAKIADKSGADIFEMNVNGVLEVIGKGGGMEWSGSGYLISESGYAITNAHVATDDRYKIAESLYVKVAKQTVAAKVIALGDQKGGHGGGVDLALLKLFSVPLSATVLKLGDYEKVKTGEPVYVIGNSLGEGTCITNGIVSDRNRNGLLMYDCPTNPGNSGGPVFNAEGVVIGTHVQGTPTRNGVKAQGMNKAIPVSEVKRFIEKAGLTL